MTTSARKRPAGKPKADAKPPRAPAEPGADAMTIFEANNLKVEKGPDPTYPWTVEGKYLYWPMSGFWRSIDGTRQGATASNLRRLIRDDNGDVARIEYPTLRERMERKRQEDEARAQADEIGRAGLAAVEEELMRRPEPSPAMVPDADPLPKQWPPVRSFD